MSYQGSIKNESTDRRRVRIFWSTELGNLFNAFNVPDAAATFKKITSDTYEVSIKGGEKEMTIKEKVAAIKAYIAESIERIGYGAAMGCTALEKLVFEDIQGWNLMEGYDDTEGLSIPSFMMINTSIYLEKLVEGDYFWLTKDQ